MKVCPAQTMAHVWTKQSDLLANVLNSGEETTVQVLILCDTKEYTCQCTEQITNYDRIGKWRVSVSVVLVFTTICCARKCSHK